MSRLDNICSYIDKCLQIAAARSLVSILTIHQTSNREINQVAYTTAPRISDGIIVFGVCNFEQDQILEIVESYQRRVDYFGIDLDKKGIIKSAQDGKSLLTGNLEKVMLEGISNKRQILGVRFDSLTIRAALDYIIKGNPFVYNQRIGLVGLGSIGLQLAIALVNCGNNVAIYKRNYQDLLEKSHIIDIIKHSSTIARPVTHSSIETVIAQQDLIILATSSKDVINTNNVSLISPCTQIISIGHAEISPAAKEHLHSRGASVIRLDIGYHICEHFKLMLDQSINQPSVASIGSKRIISSGYYGSPGDIIVDNVERPLLKYGYISKDGSFYRDFGLYEE